MIKIRQILLILIVVVAVSCKNKIKIAQENLLGCWKLIEMDGGEPTMIHYVKYEEGKGQAYWGFNRLSHLFLDSVPIVYKLSLDSAENILQTVYTSTDTAVSKLTFMEEGKYDAQVLKSKRIWSYSKITDEELENLIVGSLDTDNFK